MQMKSAFRTNMSGPEKLLKYLQIRNLFFRNCVCTIGNTACLCCIRHSKFVFKTLSTYSTEFVLKKKTLYISLSGAFQPFKTFSGLVRSSEIALCRSNTQCI